jgi:riboflavin biosynthesis pyrimidine reductase
MKPYVICHMCTTIDGKILGDRWGRLPGHKDSATLFETTAASFGIGAWLVGTTTMDEFDGPKTKLPRARTQLARRDHIANPKAKRLAIGTDTSQIIVPVVDGGVGISSFFDIPGKPPAKAAASLRMLSHKQLPGGVCWLRYRVVRYQIA